MMHRHSSKNLFKPDELHCTIVSWSCFAEKKDLKTIISSNYYLPSAPHTTKARDWLFDHYPERFLDIDIHGLSILKKTIYFQLDSLVMWLIEHRVTLPTDQEHFFLPILHTHLSPELKSDQIIY